MARKEDNKIYLTESEFNNMISETVSLLLEGRTSKWDYEACYQEAKKYKSRKEFERNAGRAYQVALKNGWLNDYTWFAPSSTAKKWDYEACYQEAKKYKSRTEFYRNANGAYKVAREKGWLNDYTWFAPSSTAKKWDYDTCYQEAKKYKSITEFERNAGGACRVARKNDWLKDYTWFEKLQPTTKNIYIVYCYKDEGTNTVYVGLTNNLRIRDLQHRMGKNKHGERIYDVLYKYYEIIGQPIPQPIILKENLYANEAQDFERYYVEYFKKEGWNVLNIAKAGSLGALYKWTEAKCYDEAKKYKSRGEFQKNAKSAYKVALKNNWLDDYTWFERPYSHNKKWDYNSCYQEAKKYNSKSEFQRNDGRAYQVALKNNWLDDYTWFERPSVHNKKWDYDACYNEAKKYTSKTEFQKNSGGAYRVALENGWLDDYTWFNKPATKKTKNISLNELKSVIKNEVSNLLKELRYKDL